MLLFWGALVRKKGRLSIKLVALPLGLFCFSTEASRAPEKSG